MSLDETQKKKVAEWLAEGLKISEIQTRLASELGQQMTYMEVRLLVDDLKLTPKDVEPAKPPAQVSEKATVIAGAKEGPKAGDAPAGTGGVSVTVDRLARPGAVVSGQVTFSDGNKAAWYLDETNRLGLVPKQQGYRPSAADVQQFQVTLQEELSKY